MPNHIVPFDNIETVRMLRTFIHYDVSVPLRLREMLEELEDNFDMAQKLPTFPQIMNNLPYIYRRPLIDELRALVHRILSKVEDTNYLLSIWNAWLDNRAPELLEVIRKRRWTDFPPCTNLSEREQFGLVTLALKFDYPKLLENPNAAVIRNVLKAVSEQDKQIAKNALSWLENLEGRKQLDILAGIYVTTRSSYLLELLIRKNHISKRHPSARIAVALRTGQQTLLYDTDTFYVVELLDATKDAGIAPAAVEVLQNLTLESSREMFGNLIFSQELTPSALDALIKSGIEPPLPEQKALFYFLTEQFDKYDALDFDYRMLRTWYRTEDTNLRRRITERVRKAGKVGYIQILTSGELELRNGELSPDELGVLLRILVSNNEWARLWELVFELPLGWSIAAYRQLLRSGWQPTGSHERELFESLRSHGAEALHLPSEAEKAFPSALQRARLRAPGRVNEVAFAPDAPVLAAATGSKKVVLWNWREGRSEGVIKGFVRSVGKLAFATKDRLVCGERAADNDHICGVYFWDGNELCKMGEHKGSITALVTLGEGKALTAGRSGNVNLWNLNTLDLLQKSKPLSYDWVRTIAVMPDNDNFFSLGSGVVHQRVADTQNVSDDAALDGKATCATVSPDGATLLVGRQNYGVLTCRINPVFELWWVHPDKAYRPDLIPQDSAVQAIHFLPNSQMLLVASANGAVNIFDYAKDTLVAKLKIECKRLTSLKISPDGNFMAVGDSDTAFSLWDLRPVGFQQLYNYPLAQATPAQLGAIRALQDGLPDAPEAVQHTLSYADIVLRHRFRYDIELEFLPDIRPGDFDIEVE
jgi:WD40 repeat protein